MEGSGSGPGAGPTNVRLELPRSSTNQRVPSVVSWAWRRLTPGSEERSISGLVFLLVETRPSSTLRCRSGMIVGSPGDGQGSSASWVWYQSGSTQTSASHSNDSVSGTAGEWAAGGCESPDVAAAAGTASPSGSVSVRSPGPAAGSRGMAPVVKS